MTKLSKLINIANYIRGHNQEYLDEILDGLKNFVVFDGRKIDNPRIISQHKVVSAGADSIDEVIEILSEQIKVTKPDSLLFLCHGKNIASKKIITLAQDKIISVEELLRRLKEKESLPEAIIFANCSQLNSAEQQDISQLYRDIKIVFIGSDRTNFYQDIDFQEICESENVLRILEQSEVIFCKIKMWRAGDIIASKQKQLNIYSVLSMYLAEEQDKLRRAQLNRLLDYPKEFELMVNFLQNPDSPMPKIYPALFEDATNIDELDREPHNLKEVNFDLEKTATTLAGLYCKSLDGEVINISQINIGEIAKKLEVSPEILLAKTNSIIASKLLDLKPLAIALGKIDVLDEIYKTKFFKSTESGFLDVEATLKLSGELLASLNISDFSYDVAVEQYQEYKLAFNEKIWQLSKLENKDLAKFLKLTCKDESLLLPDKKRIIFEIAIKYVDLLNHCPADIKTHLAYDYDFFTALCKRKGCALNYACDDFKNDKTLVLLALDNNPEAYCFIGEKLKTTEGFFAKLEELMQKKHPEYWLDWKEDIANFFKPKEDLKTAQATQVVGDGQEKANHP